MYDRVVNKGRFTEIEAFFKFTLIKVYELF